VTWTGKQTWLSAWAAALTCASAFGQEPDAQDKKVEPKAPVVVPDPRISDPKAPPAKADEPKAVDPKAAETPKSPKGKQPFGKAAGGPVPAAGAPAGAPVGKAAPLAVPVPGKAAEVQPDGRVRFYWKDADIELVLKFLEHALGVPVYRQVALPAARITIVNDRPISVDEALDTFHAVLQTVNVAVIDRRPQFLLLVALDKAKNEKLEVRFNPDPKRGQLRPRPNIIRAVFPVRGDDGANLATGLRSLVSPWGDLTFNKGDNSLTAVDTEERLLVFHEYLDRVMPSAGGAADDLRCFTLHHIEAEEAAALLARLFAASGGSAADPKNKYLKEAVKDSGAGGPLIVPNGRARQLLVRGTHDQLARVEKLLAIIDTPTLPPPPLEETVRVFPLQYADPEAVAENLRELFRADPAAASGPSGPGFEFDRKRRFDSGESGPRGFGPPGPESSAPPASGGSAAAAARAPRSTVRITPNRDQRCIVVAGSKSDLERAEKVIKEIEAIRPYNPREVVSKTYEVKHSTATDVAAILNKVFEGRTDSDATASSSSSQPSSSYGYSPYGYSPYGYGGYGGYGYSPYGGYGGYSPYGGFGDTESSRSRDRDRGSGGSSNPYIDRSWYSGSSGSSSYYRYGSSRDRSRSSGTSSGSGPAGPRTAVPDSRTNRVIVTAPTGDFVYIEKLLEDIDRPASRVSGEGAIVIRVPRGHNAEAVLRRAREMLEFTMPAAPGEGN
jgi:type II secretory pathway component GspD/PulD (secretin)